MLTIVTETIRLPFPFTERIHLQYNKREENVIQIQLLIHIGFSNTYSWSIWRIFGQNRSSSLGIHTYGNVLTTLILPQGTSKRKYPPKTQDQCLQDHFLYNRLYILAVYSGPFHRVRVSATYTTFPYSAGRGQVSF